MQDLIFEDIQRDPNLRSYISSDNELNDIETAYRSKTSYVRSFYWVYINLAHKIKAECVYADPEAPLPRWADDFVGPTWYNKNEAYEPGENDIDEDKP